MAYHKRPIKEDLKTVWSDQETDKNDLIKVTMEDGTFLYVRHGEPNGMGSPDWVLDEELTPESLRQHRITNDAKHITVERCVTGEPLILTIPTKYWRDNATFTSANKVRSLIPRRRPRRPIAPEIAGELDTYRDAYH